MGQRGTEDWLIPEGVVRAFRMAVCTVILESLLNVPRLADLNC